MNAPTQSPEPSQKQGVSAAPDPKSAASPVSSSAQTGNMPKILAGAVALLAVLLIVVWWTGHAQTSSLRKELARRLQAGDSTNIETKNLASSVQDTVKDLQGKVTALEAKQSETQTQQLALAQLYQDLSKSRDEWVLSEIDQVLSTANQQLQLSGNVQGALIALQNADRSLARLDRPQFIPVRRAIAQDINKLRALPTMDMTGTVLRLDSVIAQIDKLPLYADEKPAIPTVEPKFQPAQQEKNGQAETVSGQASEFWNAVRNKWYIWTGEMWSEVKQLVRVRNVEQSDALLVSPEQAYFIRENLKLRLLNARLSLLSRSDATFRSDMVMVQDALDKYFDPLAKQTQAVQAILKQVQASNLSVEMPELESLAAVNNFKSKH